MSLGDFIGSLQFYPWKERRLMPEEEPIKREASPAEQTGFHGSVGALKEPPEGGRARRRRASQRRGCKRKSHREPLH